MTLRIGLVGLGTAGLRHAAAIARHPAAALVAAADPAPGAQRAAAELGIPCLPDAGELLARPDVDAVVISLPHSMLAAAAIEAARRGKHILLEKPMGLSVAEAESVVAACRSAGVRLMVNYVHRFREEYRQAAALIGAGAIGRPVLLIEVMASGRSAMPPWVFQPEVAGGGMLMYNGSHSVDRLLWLASTPVARVQATTATLSYPVAVEDSACATLSFANGSLGVLVQHKSGAERTLSGWQTTVYGTSGALRVTTGQGLELEAEGGRRQISTGEGDRFLGAMEAFVAAVTEGRDPSPSGEEGVAAMRVIEAIYRAAREQRDITL